MKQKNIRWRLKNQPPLFLLVHLIRYDGQNRNHHRYPFSETHIFSFLSGYEARQTALAGSSVVPLDMSSKAQRHPRQKPQSAQSAGIRHVFLLKAPSSSSNSAGASCGSVSMTRLVCGSKVAMFEHMMPRPQHSKPFFWACLNASCAAGMESGSPSVMIRMIFLLSRRKYICCMTHQRDSAIGVIP